MAAPSLKMSEPQARCKILILISEFVFSICEIAIYLGNPGSKVAPAPSIGMGVNLMLMYGSARTSRTRTAPPSRYRALRKRDVRKWISFSTPGTTLREKFLQTRETGKEIVMTQFLRLPTLSGTAASIKIAGGRVLQCAGQCFGQTIGLGKERYAPSD